MVNRFVLFAAGVAGLSLGIVDSSIADIWVQDPTTDCQVWSGDDGSAKEVISWSGACVDGKAVGVGTLVLTDIDGLAVVFNGEMKSGKMDGWGTLKFRNDETKKFDRYIGNFENSTPKGNGIYDSSEGWRLQGYFDGAFDSGEGTLYLDEDDAVIRGEFKDGELVGDAFMFYETPEGEMYFGDIANKARDGFGTLVHASGDTYVGDFEKGVASGIGYYESENGSLVMGEFANGSPNGAATFLDVNGDSYQGIFKDGKAEGLVLVTKADGNQSLETWVDGEKQE
jgi:hypothetical protein